MNGGIEANPTFSLLFMAGVGGIIQIIVIKLMVMMAVLSLLVVFLKLELKLHYQILYCSVVFLSMFVIFSNLLVYAFGGNVFQLLGVWN